MSPLRRQIQSAARLRSLAQWASLVVAGFAAGALTFLVIDALAAEGGVPLAPSSGSSATHRFFNSCTEAEAAGAAPIQRGERGYAFHLDADNDGVACEPRPER